MHPVSVEPSSTDGRMNLSYRLLRRSAPRNDGVEESSLRSRTAAMTIQSFLLKFIKAHTATLILFSAPLAAGEAFCEGQIVPFR